jgi:hypothetical protein
MSDDQPDPEKSGIRTEYPDQEHFMPTNAGRYLSAEVTGSKTAFMLSKFLTDLANTKRDDVQSIAASQIALLVGYHEIVMSQSRKSFFWALIGAATGLGFFVAASGYALWTGNTVTAAIPVIAGAIFEVVSGIMFNLYGKTTSQLGDFHGRLETLQRYLLANSICESLQGEARDSTRSDLVREIARMAPRSPNLT